MKLESTKSGFEGELVSIPKNLMDGTTLTMIVYSEITLKPKEEEKRRKKKNGFGGKKGSVQSLVVMNQPQSAQ